jgi:hypothetical protein
MTALRITPLQIRNQHFDIRNSFVLQVGLEQKARVQRSWEWGQSSLFAA